MKKLILIAASLIVLSACAFDPVAYDELRKQEHEDHLKQNGY